jgi:hypothetical protein
MSKTAYTTIIMAVRLMIVEGGASDTHHALRDYVLAPGLCLATFEVVTKLRNMLDISQAIPNYLLAKWSLLEDFR